MNLRFTTKLNFLDTNPVIDEARFWRLGLLGSNHQFYELGASMRRLGYHPLYTLGRLAKYYSTGTLKGRRGSLYMIYYYITCKPEFGGYNSLYDEQFRHFVKSKQIE